MQFVLTFLCLGIMAPPAAQDSVAAHPATADPLLEQAISRALRDNPDVAEMELRIEAARARIGQARALPPPMADFGLVNLPVPSLSFDRDEMTMKTIGLKQDLPARGKREASSRVALAEVEVANAEHAMHVNRLIAEVADAYFELGSLDARITIARRSIDRLARLSDSARERYRVGKGALPDALLASIQTTKVRDRVHALEAQRLAAAARFATLQSLPAREPIGPLNLPMPDPVLPSREELFAAMEESPGLRQGRAEVDRARMELEQARLDRRSDVTVMGSYGQRQGLDDMVTLTASVSLPRLRHARNASQVAEKAAQLAAAERRLESLRLSLAREAEAAIADVLSLAERAALYRSTVLTQDRTAADASEQAYAVGTIDFQAYVGAVLAVDEDEAEAIARESDLMRAKARLQAATGLRFFGSAKREEEGS